MSTARRAACSGGRYGTISRCRSCAASLQAFLANIAVDTRARGEGLGRALVMEALRLAGGQRVDLLSEDDAAAFYESFPHTRKPGYRLYPFHRDDAD